MPTTLEDTVEFQAITLNDLLEADAKAGVGPVGADEGKYKTWFMLSSAAAAIFALLFVGALVTGGGGKGGEKSAKGIPKPAGLAEQPVTTTAPLPSGTGPNSHVSVSRGPDLLVANALVLSVEKGEKDANQISATIVHLAVTPDEQAKLRGQRNLQIGDAVESPASTATTVSTVPAGTPAGESPTPAPATTPTS
jgi:hypothetical protein